ncbi:MAG: class I SAM-dependent methyltransferase [Verrucomicrobia bacterium]|nr:MAG: class I SAM-dependent methyltransferase [Verrucomicrobiota bacterium]
MPDLNEPDYESRIRAQIAQYAKPEALLKLPPIYHYWIAKHIRPRMCSVFGVSNVLLFYAGCAAEAFRQPGASRRIISLGAGECVHEISLIKKLLEMGETDFVIEGLELSPLRSERAQANARKEGVQQFLEINESDLNRWVPSRRYSTVIAKDTLHHVVELEHLFDSIHEALEDEGIFVTTDMIGRNGHMRWPEALEIIQEIWKFIPDHYKTNHQLKRVEHEYVNWDCSKTGFEGIRAQDILPLLLERFSFKTFLGFANLPDIFIERGFGHNLSIDNPRDIGFIDFLEQLNTLLIDLGYLKPTMMYASMTRRRPNAPPPRYYRHWTPEFCARIEDPPRDLQRATRGKSGDYPAR